MHYNYSDLDFLNKELAGIWPGWYAVKLLGRGSFGAVYEINRNIRGTLEKSAMKVLRVPENDAEVASIQAQGVSWRNTEQYYESYVDGIQNEIRIMQQFIGNSHIVSYEDYAIRKRNNQIGWDLYIRMELLTGLPDYLKAHPYDEKLIVKMGMDIAQGLRDCHNKGIIHRDVKPDNIFVNERENFKLGDFGISRSAPGSQDLLSFKGTPGYMAPEVFRMWSTDERSDIYSLGMVLYQYLNDNRMPFVPERVTPNVIETARQRRFAGEPIPAPAHGSQRLKSIVLRALEARPENRFQTAEDMYFALMEVYKTDYKTESRAAGSETGQNTSPSSGRNAIPSSSQNAIPSSGQNTSPSSGWNAIPSSSQNTIPSSDRNTAYTNPETVVMDEYYPAAPKKGGKLLIALLAVLMFSLLGIAFMTYPGGFGIFPGRTGSDQPFASGAGKTEQKEIAAGDATKETSGESGEPAQSAAESGEPAQSAAESGEPAQSANQSEEQAKISKESGNTTTNADDAGIVYFDTEAEGTKVGICIYSFADSLMTWYRGEIERLLIEQGFDKNNIRFVDGKSDQTVQNKQIDRLIAEGADMLIVNLVDASSASEITDKAVAAGIPLVYIDHMPGEDELRRWSENNWDVCYVGGYPGMEGTLQGEIIADLGLDAVDSNGNGKIDYVMIKDDPEYSNSELRADCSIKALEDAGIEVNCLYDKYLDVDRTQAEESVSEALEMYGSDVEVIFCTSDSIMISAVFVLHENERTAVQDIYLVGIDGRPMVLSFITNGWATGTVFNNYVEQAEHAVNAAINYLNGEDNEHYIECGYTKITAENAEEFMELSNRVY